jgi:hypothetical protein
MSAGSEAQHALRMRCSKCGEKDAQVVGSSAPPAAGSAKESASVKSDGTMRACPIYNRSALSLMSMLSVVHEDGPSASRQG